MINEILMYISFGLIIISLVFYGFLILFNRKKKISNMNGFDVIKDMLSEYDRINIIEGNNNFSFYNLKRKVIKLSKKDYYGNDLSSLSLSMIQAGISVNDSKFINALSKIFPTFKILDLLFLVSLFINYISINISDAKIGIVVMIVVLFLYYLYVDMLNNVYNFINDNIMKVKGIKDTDCIINFVNKIILCHKIQFMADIIIIIRMVAIILNM